MTRTESTAVPTGTAGATHQVGELSDSLAPRPTGRTLRLRTLLPYQAYRFVRISLKVWTMVRRSHAD